MVPQTVGEPSDNPVAVPFGCRPLSRLCAPARLACVCVAVAAGLLATPMSAWPAEPAAPAATTTSATTATLKRDETPLPQDVVDGTDTGTSTSTSSSGGIARMIVGLAIVLVVIYGVYWLLKTYRRGKSTASDGRIEVVATTALAPNRSVHLLRVGDEYLLVGSAEHGITRLRVYDADQAAELLPLLESSATASRLLPARQGGRTGRGFIKAVEDLRWRTVRR